MSETAYSLRRDPPIRDVAARQRRTAKSPIRHFDLPLLATSLALAFFGVVAIYSATRPKQEALGLDPQAFLKRQVLFLIVGFVVFLALLLFDYRQLRTLSPVVYALGIFSLLIVMTPLGETVAGAQRWIDLGPFQLQPSEFMKVMLVIALAALYSDERTEPDLPKLGKAIALTALPALLIYVQPDLGTVMVLGAAMFALLLLSGTQARWLAMVAVLAGLMFVAAIQLGVLEDYQVARLTAFLDAESDSQRAGYNLGQSKIAIGSGGLTGKGLFEGSQTNLDYVPQQHTDFIFTAIAEETGFQGAIVLLGLFAFLLWRCIRIAVLSRDTFGMLLAGGIAGALVFQIFVNIGMTVGIMPITGIPLPFVSYGGSSLITSFAAVGLLMNIHMRRFI